MFKKHSIQMKMVKDAPPSNPDSTVDPIEIINATEMAVDNLITTAFGAGIALVAVKTASEIALHLMKTYIK